MILADGVDYPLLNAFWTMLELFAWILWLFLLVKIIGDLFRSPDVSGWGKAGWLVLVILLPLFGALIYLVVRGGDMHRRDRQAAEETDQAVRAYIKSAAGPSGGVADELVKLASLRDQGVITPAEFDAQKANILS